MKQTPTSPIGDSWESIRSELLTSEEIAKTDKKVAILKKTLNQQVKTKDRNGRKI